MLVGMVLWEEVRRKRSQALIPSLCGILVLYNYPPKGGVNSGGYILRREASRYISTALHRP